MRRKLRRQVLPEAEVNLLPVAPMEGTVEFRIREDIVSEESSMEALSQEVPAIDGSSNEGRYCLVVARVSWYEIHTQLPLESEFLPLR